MHLLRILRIFLHFLTATCSFFMLSVLIIFKNVIYFRFFDVLIIQLKEDTESSVIFLSSDLKNEHKIIFKQFELRFLKLKSKMIRQDTSFLIVVFSENCFELES